MARPQSADLAGRITGLRRRLVHPICLLLLSLAALTVGALLTVGGEINAVDQCMQVGDVREGESLTIVDYGTTCQISSPPRLGGGERRVGRPGAIAGLIVAAGTLLIFASAGVAAVLVARRRAAGRRRSARMLTR